MNTLQIDRILQRCRIPMYRGVYACDRMPSGPGLMVVNLDRGYKPGSHWVCVYISVDGRGEYFDTFGRPPVGLIKKYLYINCTTWVYNKKQLQSAVSKYCGHYCVLYCILRGRGINVNVFASYFSSDTGLNDLIASKMLKSLR